MRDSLRAYEILDENPTAADGAPNRRRSFEIAIHNSHFTKH